MLFSSSSMAVGHPCSAVSWKNHEDPLSAPIWPYVLMAWRMTCVSGRNPEMSTFAFRRNRAPMGGRFGSLRHPAWCRAGQM
jgi:hypothetical protein